MTTGNVLYLAMSIATFALFSAVLAYETWQQSRGARDTTLADRHEPESTITA
jgi:hypothetical protein